MHPIVDLQAAARQGNESFVKYLDNFINCCIDSQKNNIFTPKGQKQLAKIQAKIKKRGEVKWEQKK